MTTLVDADQRRIIREELDVNLVVEAAAGTGKTTELIQRIIAVLASGRASVERLVAVTFTEKAAGELKLRLRAGIEQARRNATADGPERRRLQQAVARLEEARISTIHGFCGDLLRERPVEALVDPRFEVLTEAAARRLFDEAFDRWLQERLEDPPQGIRRSLRRRSSSEGDSPSERLRRAAWDLVEWRDHRTAWRRDVFDRHGAIDTLIPRLHAFAALTRRCGQPQSDPLYRDTAAVRRLTDELQRTESVRERDYDGVEAALVQLLASSEGSLRRVRHGRGKFFAPEIARASVVSVLEEITGAIEDFAGRADADLAPLLQSELLEVTTRYDEAKRQIGALDFLDLLIRARDLVRDCDAVRADFQQRFTHIFVDEFQDTDPLQAEILLLLAARDASVRDWRESQPVPGKLFVVGDPKQSIYRFRRADVGTYLQVKAHLQHHGARAVHLTTSFRGAPSIQRAINRAFGPLMQADSETLQAEYVELSPYRSDPTDQPTIVALPVPEPYGWTGVTKTAIHKSLPDAVGAFLEWLLAESGWTVTEPGEPDRRVPVSARHVCLLFRRFSSMFWGDVTRGYAQALEARGIPHLLVGGKSFHVREEVEAMRAALSAIEWPDDELSVFATLHGSLFAIGDEELLRYRHLHGRLNPFHPAGDEVPFDLVPVVQALELLAALHRGRNRGPISDTVARLLEETRAHAGFVLRPSGEQVLANVLHVAELARASEHNGGLSFRAFVEQLIADAANGEAPEAPILEEGSDGVRLMTTHRAKGLEFPVVVLADMTTNPSGAPSRYVDAAVGLAAVRIGGWSPAELLEHASRETRRDDAEALRLAYVAATRARDLLVVPAVGDAPFEAGWVSCLNGAIYPSALQRQQVSTAPGCPKFGPDSVLDRNGKPEPGEGCVRPGRHDFSDPDYSVVWWDPQALILDAHPLRGIRQEELLGATTDPEVLQSDLQRYRAWEASRAAAIDAGSRPSMVTCTATQRSVTEITAAGGAAPDGLAAATSVEVMEVQRMPGRPAGPRFGALVHAVLATVELDAMPARVEQVAALQGRVLGATPEEMAAAAAAVERALCHPLLERARTAAIAGGCRRETPVALVDDDGALVDGVVDLAFCEEGKWTVVDFKTDRDLRNGLDAYRRQVILYARAICRATGAETTGVLLRV